MTTPATPAANTITELRAELFAAIRALKPGAKPEDIARAKTIAELAQTVINSAKVEVDLLKVTGGKNGSGFIPLPAPGGATVIEDRPGVRVTQHRLRD